MPSKAYTVTSSPPFFLIGTFTFFFMHFCHLWHGVPPVLLSFKTLYVFFSVDVELPLMAWISDRSERMAGEEPQGADCYSYL